MLSFFVAARSGLPAFPPPLALPKLTSDSHTQRLTIRGDLDRAYLALRVLSQEREKLDQVASAVANASPEADTARAKL